MWQPSAVKNKPPLWVVMWWAGSSGERERGRERHRETRKREGERAPTSASSPCSSRKKKKRKEGKKKEAVSSETIPDAHTSGLEPLEAAGLGCCWCRRCCRCWDEDTTTTTTTSPRRSGDARHAPLDRTSSRRAPIEPPRLSSRHWEGDPGCSPAVCLSAVKLLLIYTVNESCKVGGRSSADRPAEQILLFTVSNEGRE